MDKLFADIMIGMTTSTKSPTSPPPPSPELPASPGTGTVGQSIVPYGLSSDEEESTTAASQHPLPPSSRPRKKRVIEDSSSDGGAPLDMVMDTANAGDDRPQPSTLNHRDDSPSPPQTIDLYLLSTQELWGFFSEHFTSARLEDLAKPQLCDEFPGLEDDILEGYAHYTCFSATIWINFDAAEGVFFEGARAADCGKLLMPKRKYASIAALDPDTFPIQKVRLDICTPFRQLAEVCIRSVPNHHCLDIEVTSTRYAQYMEDCDNFTMFLESVTTTLGHTSAVCSRAGFTVHDIELIAKLFCRDRVEYPGHYSEWENVIAGGGEWTAPPVQAVGGTFKLRRSSSTRTMVGFGLRGGGL